MTGARTLAFGLAVAAGLAAAAAPAAVSPQARERHVLVSVTDDGTPVPNLTVADFVVREDDIAREVLRVSPAPPPSHIGLVVDDSESTRAVVAELRRGLTALVVAGQQSTPPPQMGLMTIGDRPTRVVPHTAGATALQTAIDRLFARPGSGAYLLDALLEESQALQRLGAERPAIIAFVSDGSPEFSSATRRSVETALRETGASLWTLTLQGAGRNPVTESEELRQRAMVVTDVAELTGGMHRNVLSAQGIEDAMAAIVRAIGARYDVTYSQPDALIPPERLDVSVRRSGLQVAATHWPRR